MRYGAILESVQAMKRCESFDIYVDDQLVFSTEDELEALDKIQDLSEEYFEKGHPDPSTVQLVRYG